MSIHKQAFVFVVIIFTSGLLSCNNQSPTYRTSLYKNTVSTQTQPSKRILPPRTNRTYTPEGIEIRPLSEIIPNYAFKLPKQQVVLFNPTAKELAQIKHTPSATHTLRTYQIQKGDTLSSIAKRYYHDAKQYHKIIKANPALKQNPNRLLLGTVIIIP